MKNKILALALTFFSLVTVVFGLFYDIKFLLSMSTGTNYKYLGLGLGFLCVAYALISFAWLVVPRKVKK